MPNSDTHYDYIIVGQGLAGSLLAYRLIQAKQNILVIDNKHEGSSSAVAAGIINPITGYRLTTHKLFAQQLQTAVDLYTHLEDLFSEKLIENIQQYRLLKSEEQVRYWHKRCQHPQFLPYTGEAFQSLSPFIANEFGVVQIHQSQRVYVQTLLRALKRFFMASNVYSEAKVDAHHLVVNEKKIQLNDWSANKVIFCEGYQAIHNPFWQHLPFKLSKGEILTLELETSIDGLYNWRQWILPKSGLTSNRVLLGANYEWGDFTESSSLDVTQAAKETLLMRLETNTKLKGKTIKQVAGIRPTPTHRYPYIGPHQSSNTIYCFNGFGSKGSVAIPYYSQLLCQHLLEGKPLPSEVTQFL